MKQDEDGHLTTRDMDKAEEFNAFFAPAFSADDGPRGYQCPELEDHDSENQLLVDPELCRICCCKSLGPDGIHHRIPKELADVAEKHFLMIFEWFQES